MFIHGTHLSTEQSERHVGHTVDSCVGVLQGFLYEVGGWGVNWGYWLGWETLLNLHQSLWRGRLNRLHDLHVAAA